MKTVTIYEPCLSVPPPGERSVHFNLLRVGDVTDMPEEERVFYVTRTSLENYVYNRDSIRDWAAEAYRRCSEEDLEEKEEDNDRNEDIEDS